jgi:SAM-dependent methyltransferase
MTPAQPPQPNPAPAHGPLAAESERLARSWERHSPEFLRHYLVADVEDPRLNIQSLLTRHFLALALDGGQTRELAEAELRFAACLNWILRAARELNDLAALAGIRLALDRNADNAEGFPVPVFVRQTFAQLPAAIGPLSIPNYLALALESTTLIGPNPALPTTVLDLFARLWDQALPAAAEHTIAVLEPACGSANDYRFIEAFGLARLLDYHGIDIAPTNVANARALFPRARFDSGNAFALDAPARAYDLCFVHDLFEHLSPDGLTAALDEICRVTRLGLCLHFFNMDEIPDHIIRPVDEYHWNTLSLARIQERLGRNGFHGQAFHIGTFLRYRLGCDSTHNPNAYTLILAATHPA